VLEVSGAQIHSLSEIGDMDRFHPTEVENLSHF